MALYVSVPSPIIPDDPQVLAPMGIAFNKVVSHVWFNEGKIIDSVGGNQWTKGGSIKVSNSDSVAGYPAAAGPFTDADFFSLGTGADVFDFGSDFMGVLVWDGVDTSTSRVLASNGSSGVSGWYIQTGATNGKVVRFVLNNGATLNDLLSGPTTINGAINICIFGIAGTTMYIGVNDSSIFTLTSTGSRAQATSTIAYLGRYSSGGFAYGGSIFEFWAGTMTPTVASISSMMQYLRGRVGRSS